MAFWVCSNTENIHREFKTHNNRVIFVRFLIICYFIYIHLRREVIKYITFIFNHLSRKFIWLHRYSRICTYSYYIRVGKIITTVMIMKFVVKNIPRSSLFVSQCIETETPYFQVQVNLIFYNSTRYLYNFHYHVKNV